MSTHSEKNKLTAQQNCEPGYAESMLSRYVEVPDMFLGGGWKLTQTPHRKLPGQPPWGI